MSLVIGLCVTGNVVIKMCFSLIDRRGIVVAEDVRATAAVPVIQAATASEAVNNEAFANSTVADINPSVDERLVSSDKVVMA